MAAGQFYLQHLPLIDVKQNFWFLLANHTHTHIQTELMKNERNKYNSPSIVMETLIFPSIANKSYTMYDAVV